MIGLPIIFVLLFMKGVIVGFTVGFLVNQMGAQGFFSRIRICITPKSYFSTCFYCCRHLERLF